VTYRRAAVHMPRPFRLTAVGRLQRRNDRRPPPRAKLAERSSVQRPHENRVFHDPQFAARPPRHLMALDVPRDVTGTRQEAGVVAVETSSDGRDVHVLPDLDGGADGQPVAIEGHAHRGLERAEVGVEVVALVADDHELAGLIGGDQQSTREFPQ